MARIAHGGFLHETNTFAPVRAEFRHFEQGEGWPGLTRGADILDVFPAINIGTGGFIPRARALGHELLPLAWAAAVPSSYVTDDAYETVVAILLEDLEKALRGGIDGIYLDLHGAMVVESYEDGEGELLRRVRALTGPDMPLVVSLDLHANVTEAMMFHADALIAYRTYPHLDMAETGDRAARHLDALLRGRKGGQNGDQSGSRPRQAKAFRKLPFLYGLTSQCTMLDPSKGVYEELEAIEAAMAGAGVSVLSYTPGFPPADIRDCGPAVLAYADTPAAADTAADRLAGYILERESEFAAEMLSPDEAVRRAMAAPPGKPTVLADFQDNSGAGATSDTTGLLAALVRNGAEGAVLGLLTDPGAAAAAHEAGEGAEIVLDVGGKIFLEGDPPFRATFAVERVSDGRFLCTGPFYGGTQADLGPTALLRVTGSGAGGDVRVIVTSGRMQAADKEMFRHIGVEPAEQRILGLKSSVHFRGDFTDIAREILLVEAPGAFIDRPERLPYRNLREGVRLCPGGPEFRRPA